MGMTSTARGAARMLAGVPLLRGPVGALSRAGLVPYGLWRRLPVEHEFTVRCPGARPFRYRGSYGDNIARYLYWRGLEAWEPETIALYQRLIPRTRLFLDIGANTGFYSMLGCALNADLKVIAFEPVPNVFERCREMIERNEMGAQCELHQAAVTDESGTVQLHVPNKEIPTSASLITNFGGHEGHLVDVPAVRVDDVVGDRQPDLVKLDVEGVEDRALRGMEKILAGPSPTMFVEMLPDGPYKTVEQMLRDHGYALFEIDRHELRETAAVNPLDPVTKLWNYLAVKRPDDLQLARTMPRW